MTEESRLLRAMAVTDDATVTVRLYVSLSGKPSLTTVDHVTAAALQRIHDEYTKAIQ